MLRRHPSSSKKEEHVIGSCEVRPVATATVEVGGADFMQGGKGCFLKTDRNDCYALSSALSLHFLVCGNLSVHI